MRHKYRSGQVTGEDYRPFLTWFKGQVGGAQKLLATILKQHVFMCLHVFTHARMHARTRTHTRKHTLPAINHRAVSVLQDGSTSASLYIYTVTGRQWACLTQVYERRNTVAWQRRRETDKSECKHGGKNQLRSFQEKGMREEWVT